MTIQIINVTSISDKMRTRWESNWEIMSVVEEAFMNPSPGKPIICVLSLSEVWVWKNKEYILLWNTDGMYGEVVQSGYLCHNQRW